MLRKGDRDTVGRLAEEAHADAANQLREIRETARRNADREAKKIVALAIQRIAADTTAETRKVSRSCPPWRLRTKSGWGC